MKSSGVRLDYSATKGDIRRRVYDDLGLREVIDTCGTLTQPGRSRIAPEVLAGLNTDGPTESAVLTEVDSASTMTSANTGPDL